MTIRPTLPEWTVLVYLDGDNDLRENVSQDLVEMSQAGPRSRTEVAATLYRGHRKWNRKNLGFKLRSLFKREKPCVLPEDWRGRRVYHVSPDGRTQEVASPPPSGRVSEPASLRDFVAWGMKQYPARHTMVILAGHGDGHRGLMMDGDGRQMAVPELREALEQAQAEVGRKVDVLGLESCQMGQASVAYELKDVTGWLVASPELVYDGGWRHDLLLQRLETGALSPREAAAALVESAREGCAEDVPTLAAVDTSRMVALREALDGLATALKAATARPSEIERIVYASRSYGPPDLSFPKPKREFIDLGDFARRLEELDDPTVKQAARTVREALKAAVPAHYDESDPNTGGLSIYHPTQPAGLFTAVEKEFTDLRMAREGGWDEYLAERPA